MMITMTTTIIKKTLADFEIEHKMISDKANRSYRGNAGKYEMLISEVNDYRNVYGVNMHLLKSDNAQGQNLIRAMYNLVPAKTEYIYMLYTNSVKGVHLTRMLQHVWAFPSIEMAQKFMPEMVEQLSWAKHSHIVALPLESDITQHNLSEIYVDPYYYLDVAPILRRFDTGYTTYQSLDIPKPLEITPDLAFDQFEKRLQYNQELFEIIDSIKTQGISKSLLNELKHLVQRRKHLAK